jgi:hypothetical protein
MSDHERLTSDETAQTTANLRLAAQFVHELIDHPERHEALPDNATVVFLPGDDPGDSALSHANMKMARRFAAQGRDVVAWAIGTPAIPGPQILPRWPYFLGKGSGFTYDRRRNTLTVIFSETDRPTIPTRMNPYITVFVDGETRAARSMTISSFIWDAVQKAPSMVFFLLHPSTRLIGMTKAELAEFVVGFVQDLLEPDRAQVTWSQIFDELSA